ncbi:MAG: HEAT repeat domain-containing protein [Planctomycetota bacterium]|jgi:HEAT repeat protein
MHFGRNICRLFVVLFVVCIILSARSSSSDAEGVAAANDSVSEQVAEIFAKADRLTAHRKQRSREYLTSLPDAELAGVYARAMAPQQVASAGIRVTDSYVKKIKKDRQKIIEQLSEHRSLLDEQEDKDFDRRYAKLADDLVVLGATAVPELSVRMGYAYRRTGRPALAKKALLKMGPAAVEPLMPLMGSDDSCLRSNVTYVLSRLADERAQDALLNALDDKDGTVRVYAIEGLVNLGPDVIGQTRLVTALTSHLEDMPCMRECIAGLEKYGDETAVESLRVIERFYPALKDIKAGSLRYPARQAIDAILRRAGKSVQVVSRGDYSQEDPTYQDLCAAAQCSNAAIRVRAIGWLGRYRRDDKTARFLIERIDSERKPVGLHQLARTLRTLMTSTNDSGEPAVSPQVLQEAFDAFLSAESISIFSVRTLSILNPMDSYPPEQRELLAAAIRGAVSALYAANERRMPLERIERLKNTVWILGLPSNDSNLRSTSYWAIGTIAELFPETGKSWLQYQKDQLQEQLSPLLATPNPNLMLIECLGYIGDKQLTPRLIELLRHNDASIRRFAAYALGRIADIRALPTLERLAESDPHQYENGVFGVRKAAAQAIASIRAKQAGSHPASAPTKNNQSHAQTINGLKALLSCSVDTIRVSEPVVVELQLQNASDGEITYYDFKKRDPPDDIRVTWVITLLVDGKPVGGHTILDADDIGHKVATRRTPVNLLYTDTVVSHSLPPISRKAFVVLKPGEKVAYLKVDLQPVWFIHEASKQAMGPLQIPGEHAIQIEYQNRVDGRRFGLDAWTGTVKSNVVTVKVEGNRPADADIRVNRAGNIHANGRDRTDVSVDDIINRLCAALEKAYADVGLSKEDVQGLFARQAPPQKLMGKWKAYQETWPAIVKAREAAIKEMVLLGPGAVPALLEATDKSDERRGGDIFVSVIAGIGKPAVPAVIDGLSHENTAVRARAAASLGKIHDRRAVEPLVRTLSDSDRGVLSAAVRALGFLKDQRAVEPLLRHWKKDVIRRSELAWALGHIGDRRATIPIMIALEECINRAQKADNWDVNSWDMRVYAGALGQIGDNRAVPLLRRMLLAGPQRTKAPTRRYWVAEAAARALRSLGVEVTGDMDKGNYQIVKVSPQESAPKPSRIKNVRGDTPKPAGTPHRRDYVAALSVPQPLELWMTKRYGCGGNPRTQQKLRTDVKRRYPISLTWPLIRGASKYVVQIEGVRGSQPATSFESAKNCLHLGEPDIAPGRYRWSVSVYDNRGRLMGDIETIDPVEVFAIDGPEPFAANGKKVLIDLSHSAGHVRGWGYYNHAQYMTKELLEEAGFEVELNERDLLTAEKLESVDLLICNYYWTGWPDFRAYLKSEIIAVRDFVDRGGSLLLVGCDRKDGGNQMSAAGNELAGEFGLRFQLDEIGGQEHTALPDGEQNIISFGKPIPVQLPVGVEGDAGITLLRFGGVPIARADRFGDGKLVVAGTGMSFLDCYLGDFQNREPLHLILFYDIIRYLTGVDWKQNCRHEFVERVLSRHLQDGGTR